MTQPTLGDVDNLAAEVAALHVRKKEAEEVFNEAKSEYNKKAFKLMNILSEHDKKRHEGSFGRISVVEKHYFKIIDEDQCTDWLKEDGHYEALRKVSAADFSKRAAEVCVEDGPNKTKIVNPELVPIGSEHVIIKHLRVT